MIYETPHYVVQLTEGSQSYSVVNKTTGVVEYDGNVLPRAIIAANEYELHLSALLKLDEKGVHNAANIVSIR
jgi:hypothetical protein